MKTAEKRQAAIGTRVRSLRLQKKMRQVDLAKTAGLSWRHLIRIELGEGGEPKTETLDRLAGALGVARAELTGEDDDEEVDRVVDLDLALRSYLRRLIREEVRS